MEILLDSANKTESFPVAGVTGKLTILKAEEKIPFSPICGISGVSSGRNGTFISGSLPEIQRTLPPNRRRAAGRLTKGFLFKPPSLKKGLGPWAS
jgi:hypothetical protein